MAVAATLLTSSIDGVDRTSYTTASIAPTANNLVLAVIASYGDFGITSPVVDALTGVSMTWTQVGTLQTNDSSVYLDQLTIFRALSASPGSGALTIDFGTDAPEIVAWSVVQFSGIDTSGTNGANAIRQSKFATVNPTSTNAQSLAFDTATVAANGTFGAIVNSSGSRTIAPGASFTELSDVTTTVGGNMDLETEFANTGIDTLNWTLQASGDVAVFGIVEISLPVTTMQYAVNF